jgi:hypothetical protein
MAWSKMAWVSASPTAAAIAATKSVSTLQYQASSVGAVAKAASRPA